MSNDWKNDDLPEWLSTDLDWLDEYKPRNSPTGSTANTPRAADSFELPEFPFAEEPVRRAAKQPEQPSPRRAVPKTARTAERPAQEAQPNTGRAYTREENPNAERAYERERRERTAPQRDSYESARRRGRRGGGTSKLLIALIVVLGLGMIFAAWRLSSFLLNYRRDRSAYNELASNATFSLVQPAGQTEESEPVPTGGGGSGAGLHVESEIPLSVDWEYLRGLNSDIVGWLYCPDTIVNYPVVQTEDHDFYLTHGFDRNPNTSGTLFAEQSSVLGITQSNYIIYGHNMKDESMFGTFKNYVNKSYFDQHPTMYYLTPNGCYRIDLICAHIVESTYDNFPGYFSNMADYQSYINQIAASSFWVDYSAINTEHQLITLTTCTSAAGYDDARFVVHGMMVPIQ